MKFKNEKEISEYDDEYENNKYDDDKKEYGKKKGDIFASLKNQLGMRKSKFRAKNEKNKKLVKNIAINSILVKDKKLVTICYPESLVKFLKNKKYGKLKNLNKSNCTFEVPDYNGNRFVI